MQKNDDEKQARNLYWLAQASINKMEDLITTRKYEINKAERKIKEIYKSKLNKTKKLELIDKIIDKKNKRLWEIQKKMEEA